MASDQLKRGNKNPDRPGPGTPRLGDRTIPPKGTGWPHGKGGVKAKR